MDARPIVLTRFAVKYNDNPPTREWLERRLGLLRYPQRGLDVAAVRGLVWALLVDPGIPADVRASLERLKIANGEVRVISTPPGGFHTRDDAPEVYEQVSDVVGDRTLLFRLDSDDVLLPAAIRSVQRLAGDARPGTLFDMWFGYRLNVASGRLSNRALSAHAQSPFLAWLRTREDALDYGASDENHVREHATAFVSVPGRSFVQVVHGGNVCNAERGWPTPYKAAAIFATCSGSLYRRAMRVLDGVGLPKTPRAVAPMLD